MAPGRSALRVQPLHLRLRTKVLTWQELADALPAELQNFLEQKYGILSASAGRTG